MRLDTLPFEADAENLAFDLFVGFRPELRLSASAGWNDTFSMEGGVGVFMDIPMLTVNVAPLTMGNTACQAGSSNESVYVLTPNVAFGSSGLVKNLDVNIGGVSFSTFDEEPFMFYTAPQSPLDIECLKWDAEKKVLTDPKKQKAAEKSFALGNQPYGGWGISGFIPAILAAVMVAFM